MTSAKSILKAQINIWTKVLKCAGDQISFTHATVDQLKEHLGKLTGAELPLESEDLSDIIIKYRDPESLTGMYIAHQWADEIHQRDWYYGQIVEFMNETSEYKVTYEREETPCYMKPGEIITDIIRGDLVLQQL